jgi:hypothetical protein
VTSIPKPLSEKLNLALALPVDQGSNVGNPSIALER